MGRSQTIETRKKISASLNKQVALNCLCCKREYFRILSKVKRSKFCSNRCSAIFRNRNGLARKRGLASVAMQSETKRSRNEILFSELCAAEFVIETNKPMFEGWDADVIIHSLKIAILWNGPWHYKQISKSSSLEQIQNRDKIKLDVIVRCGYVPYVIKDMGKFNPKFVHEEFATFMMNTVGREAVRSAAPLL